MSEILLSGAWARVWSPRNRSRSSSSTRTTGRRDGASLRAGLDAIADAFPAEIEALLVTLVDLPDVTSEVHRRVIHSAAHHAPRRGELAAGLWRAAFAGVPGHPVLIGRDHWAGVATSATGDRGRVTIWRPTSPSGRVRRPRLRSGRGHPGSCARVTPWIQPPPSPIQHPSRRRWARPDTSPTTTSPPWPGSRCASAAAPHGGRARHGQDCARRSPRRRLGRAADPLAVL